MNKKQKKLDFLLRIQLGHCFLNADKTPRTHASNDLFCNFGDIRLLLRRKTPEHEIDLLSLGKIVAHADAEARPLAGLEELFDIAQSVVAAVAAVAAQADRTERKVDVVADDEQVVQGDLQFLEPVADGVAAEVHVGRGLEEMEFPALVMDDGLVAVSSGFENDIGCLGPGIQYHKADVVSRRSVLGTDVAEPDYQITLVSHGGVGFTPPQQPQ